LILFCYENKKKLDDQNGPIYVATPFQASRIYPDHDKEKNNRNKIRQMKQGLLLMAIYTLIINQARKANHQENISEVVSNKMEAAVPISSPKDQLRIDKYEYLDQSVFLVTSADNKSFIMLEDGTCYEVIDRYHNLDKHTDKSNADYYTNALYKNKEIAQQ
jgi:hypothetical protein